VDRGVIATANELFEARHFPGVVAMCSDALDDEPECVPLLLIRARARMALRRDLDAQADLRDIIRLDPRCSLAYRLLGELAARRDETASAAVFFREALRLDPGDREAQEWLQIVTAPRPAAAATRLPATAAAAGRLSSPSRAPSPSPARLARGTQPPDQVERAARAEPEERPTQPFGKVTEARRVRSQAATPPGRPPVRPTPTPEPLPPPPEIERPTLSGRPPTQPPAKPAPRLTARGATPELPGFGEYLVAAGILTRERLRAAQAYQRSMRVQLSTAIVTLGLASPQRIEWAAVAHQSQLPRG
jgi:tetratricopeptide (TPR) repeat protein